MRRVLIAGLLLAVAGDVPISAKTLRMKGVRHWTLVDSTRIQVDLSGPADYRTERLFNPDRLLFDLLNTTAADGKRGIRVRQVDDKLVRKIRIAETRPGVVRIVVDLNSRAAFSVTQLTSPPRFLIELVPGTVPRPAVPPLISEAPLPSGEDPIAARNGPVPSPDPPPARPREKTAAEKMAEEARSERQRKNRSAAAKEIAAKEVVPDPGPAIAQKAPQPPALPPALAAKPRAGGSSTMIRALGLKMGRVVIDPGHGGHDHGSTGKGGLVEKELVLDVAKRLGSLIEDQLGVEVVYTRGDDTFIPLEKRTEIANDRRADLFISIHANSSPYRSVAGVETYYLNLTSSREALEIAARENASSQRSIHELTDIIEKITVNDKIAESREFATTVQQALHGGVSRVNPSASNRGVKKAPFVVLLGAQMPSILTEIGFISNQREESLLKKGEHRQKVAESILAGVKKYAETLSHFQMATKD